MLVCVILEVCGDGVEVDGGAVIVDYERSDNGFSDGDVSGDDVGVGGCCKADHAKHALDGWWFGGWWCEATLLGIGG